MDSEIKVEGVVGTDVIVEVVMLSETVAEARTGDSPKTPPPPPSEWLQGGRRASAEAQAGRSSGGGGDLVGSSDEPTVALSQTPLC